MGQKKKRDIESVTFKQGRAKRKAYNGGIDNEEIVCVPDLGILIDDGSFRVSSNDCATHPVVRTHRTLSNT